MKKAIAIILSVLCLALASAKSAKPVLVSSEPCEYRETFIASDWEGHKSTLTYAEFASDLDMLCFYLATAYADYDGMCARGFSGEKLKETFLAVYAEQEKIDTRNAFKAVTEYLKPFIADRHFGIFTRTGRFEPITCSTFFYTNTFVEKSDGGFFLFASDNESLAAGMRYEGGEEHLFYYPVKGERVYRIGTTGIEKPSTLSVMFDSKPYQLPLFDDGAIQLSAIKYHELETADTGYASISSFLLPDEGTPLRRGADIVLTKYASLAARWRDKKSIIIDLRGNQGGNGAYSEYLFYSLYTNNRKEFSWEKLSAFNEWMNTYIAQEEWIDSPTTREIYVKYLEKLGYSAKEARKYLDKAKKSPKRAVYRSAEIRPLEQNKESFAGKVLVLIDRNSLSASEEAAMLAKQVFGSNAVIIGEKTGGCCEYWDNCDFALPISKVCMHFGSKRNEKPNYCDMWHGEGEGLYPDYWALGDDLNETIFLVTDDEEMRAMLDGIEGRLM